MESHGVASRYLSMVDDRFHAIFLLKYLTVIKYLKNK